MESNLKDFTEKEATAYDKSLSKMYKPTGVKLDDLMNEALDKALDKASEQEIQIRLGKHFGIKNICIPNVLMTGEYRKEILPEIEKLEPWKRPSKMYEADLVYITKSKYLTEIEIKVNMNDFRNDFNKKIYHSSPIVSALYYALPEELYKKHKDEIQKRVAGIAGIITVSYDCKIDAKAPKRKDVEPLTDTQIKDFMRIGCMKWFKGGVCDGENATQQKD